MDITIQIGKKGHVSEFVMEAAELKRCSKVQQKLERLLKDVSDAEVKRWTRVMAMASDDVDMIAEPCPRIKHLSYLALMLGLGLGYRRIFGSGGTKTGKPRAGRKPATRSRPGKRKVQEK